MGMDRRKRQAIAEQHPENDHRHENDGQQTDLPRRNRENIANKLLVIFCKAVAAQRGDKNAQSHRCAGENTD